MIKGTKEVSVSAPCKINLHLGIGEKRPDGFHNIESLFACLALSDTLKFVRSGKEGECTLSTSVDGGMGEKDNLVCRAVTLYRERTGFKDGLEVYLDKRIPVGAGLGGGSSDAASTLIALNTLSENPVSMEELMEMAAILGSDVPFFLFGGLAYVSGRGELIEPLETASLNGLWVVLVMPPFSSDTINAYRLLDISRQGAKPESSFAPRTEGSTRLCESFLQKDPRTWPFCNDFLPVFLDAGGENACAYRAILEGLRKAGASFAGLSGTGSCCFGIFTTKEKAKIAEKDFTMRGNFARLTFFLANRANPVLK